MDSDQTFKLHHLIWIAGVAWLLCACHSWVAAALTDESTLLEQCISNFDPNVDYYQKLLPPDVTNQSFVLPLPLDLQEVDTATGFAVNYGNYYKVVENQFFNLTYILYQCGAPRPSPLAVGLPSDTDARTFQLPVANLTTDSTIPLAFLELLGQLDNLSLPSSVSDFVSSSCVLQYIADGDITKIPESGVNFTSVVFTAATGTPVNQSNAVSFDATYDGGPLKRAEWIKYLATFVNVEDRAENIFYYVNISYQCMNGSMGSSTSKPTIGWLLYDGMGIWSLSNATYKLQFDSDAGGINLDADTLSMNFNLSDGSELNSFHQVLRQLDVVVDETYAADPYSYTLENFTANAQVDATDLSIPIIENRRVWRVDKRIGLNEGYDWYESAIPQPHVVLYDLIGILYPSKGWNQTYFRNIAMNEEAVNVSALVCTRRFGEALDVVVIPDPEVMKCVNETAEVSSKSSATSIPYSCVSLLTTMCTLLILPRSGLM